MLKLTSLALGLLTVIAIAPNSEAMSASVSPLPLQQPAGDLHAQVILKIGQPGYSRRSEVQRRRELQLQRQRAAELRRNQRGHHGKYYRHNR